jgi:hypothetical protein
MFHSLRSEIDELRAGEEGGWVEGILPTPGQYLKRLHDLDEERRIQSLGVLLSAAEAGRQCAMSLHEGNLHELRQRTMTSWSTLADIAALCRDPERDGVIHVSEVTELLPEALRYG